MKGTSMRLGIGTNNKAALPPPPTERGLVVDIEAGGELSFEIEYRSADALGWALRATVVEIDGADETVVVGQTFVVGHVAGLTAVSVGY
jgi:hypothetical protein